MLYGEYKKLPNCDYRHINNNGQRDWRELKLRDYQYNVENSDKDKEKEEVEELSKEELDEMRSQGDLWDFLVEQEKTADDLLEDA